MEMVGNSETTYSGNSTENCNGSGGSMAVIAATPRALNPKGLKILKP